MYIDFNYFNFNFKSRFNFILFLMYIDFNYSNFNLNFESRFNFFFNFISHRSQ